MHDDGPRSARGSRRRARTPRNKALAPHEIAAAGQFNPCRTENRASKNYLLSQKVESLLKSKRVDLLDQREGPANSTRMSKMEKRIRDKSDRACVQKVLDNTTKMILYKLINQEITSSVMGCISTGKEANVYHGITSSGEHLAIKIFKTVTSSFKRRERYVKGDYRFTNRYVGPNKLKAVRVWAEKEMRNLKRINENGILCPEVILLKSHVLVMRLVGNQNGWAAPTLKDYSPDGEEEKRGLYFQAVTIMYKMFHHCRLIHADYSEYNLLVSGKQLHVIDVSQSVEPDHPMATEFLARDCFNITNFFRTSWCQYVPDAHRLLHFITTAPEELIRISSPDMESPTIAEALQHCLEKLLDLAGALDAEQLRVCIESEAAFRENYTLCSAYKTHLDTVFLRKVYISYSGDPSLWMSQDHTTKLVDRSAGAPEPFDASLTSLCNKMNGLFTAENDAASTSSCSSASSSSSSRPGPGLPGKKHPQKKFMDRDDKREHKKLVKEQKREKRLTKIRKKTKKRNKKKHVNR